jgi:copper chaperone NosL
MNTSKISLFSKVVLLVVSALFFASLWFPMWRIELEAPQYPEGLVLQLHANKIGGDVAIINGLNHYIGMKKIEPDSIKELTIMPYILGFLIIAGVLAGILGRRKLFTAWVIIFMIAGLAGGVDFYMWEYDYGHNLDTTAAIIVPGMSYQPPLIGSKQLLNFVANSYPDTGGFIVISAGLLGVIILLYEKRMNKKSLALNKSTTIKENEKANVKDSVRAYADSGPVMQH